MSAFGEFPSPRDPYDSAPRFDMFGAFAFLAVLVVFGAMCAGLLVKTSTFELPDIFGTKAQEQAQRLLQNVALPTAAPIAQANAEPTATPGAKTIVPVVPGEAAEAAITIPFGIGSNQRTQPGPSAQPTAAPTAIAATSQHAVGSLHKVANTNGDGVYLRRTPGTEERIRAWPDNTVMEYQGEMADVRGAGWAKMKDPAGNVGWIPVQYLTPYDGPRPAPAPAQPAPAPQQQPAPAAPAPAPAAQPQPAPAPAQQPAPSGVQTVPIGQAQPSGAGIVTQPIARPAAPRR